MRKQPSSSWWQDTFRSLGFGHHKTHRKADSVKHRSLHMECLEQRQLLTAAFWPEWLSSYAPDRRLSVKGAVAHTFIVNSTT